MNLFPNSQRPYYIWSPSYTDKSSGVRTLHTLCHLLNESGQTAYVWPDNPNFSTNPALNTPLVSPQHHNYYNEFLNPIVIYPDIVSGNPLRAKHVVRYLMAPAGAYGGDSAFPDTDNIWGCMPSLAEKVLTIPVSDPDIFHPPSRKRSTGSCFYSHKYEMHGHNLLEMPVDCERVCGTLRQCADILRSKEVCYVYEVSATITEAGLCGCPVVLMRTDYFNTIDPKCLMGDVKWNDGEIVRQCPNFYNYYEGYIDRLPNKLKEFIQDTQWMGGN